MVYDVFTGTFNGLFGSSRHTYYDTEEAARMAFEEHKQEILADGFEPTEEMDQVIEKRGDNPETRLFQKGTDYSRLWFTPVEEEDMLPEDKRVYKFMF